MRARALVCVHVYLGWCGCVCTCVCLLVYASMGTRFALVFFRGGGTGQANEMDGSGGRKERRVR